MKFLWLNLIFFCLELRFSDCVIISMKEVTFHTQRLNVIAASTVPVEIKDVPLKYRYIQIGAHSQKENITLSETSTGDYVGNHVIGNNVGLVMLLERLEQSSIAWIINRNSVNITTLLTVTLNLDNAPIPGGCNMEFPVEISPFLEVFYNRVNISVEYQHANIGYKRDRLPPSCDTATNYLSYDLYLYFLEENDFEEDDYFKAITMMTNRSTILSKAVKVSPFEMNPKTRVNFDSYPGQGVIYNIITSYKYNSTIYDAAYVPAATYGCSFSSKVDGCGHLTGTFAKVLMIISALFGLVICLFGHRLFKTAMFCFGFLAFALISFILLTKYTDLEPVARNYLTVTCGIVGAFLLIIFWCCLGFAPLVLIITGFVFGFLIMSIIYYTPVGDTEILRNDINYWLIFSCGMIFVAVISLPNPKMAVILSSSIVGSYVFIGMLDRYLHSVLSYIILNVVKRALFENLNIASNIHPFQTKDIILVCVWGILAFLGICLQSSMQKNKPPLPISLYEKRKAKRYQYHVQYPSMPTSPPIQDSERRPLLFDRRNNTYDSTVVQATVIQATVEYS